MKLFRFRQRYEKHVRIAKTSTPRVVEKYFDKLLKSEPQYSRSSKFWHIVNSRRCPKCGAKRQEVCRDARMIFPRDIVGSRLHVERLGRKLGRTIEV